MGRKKENVRNEGGKEVEVKNRFDVEQVRALWESAVRSGQEMLPWRREEKEVESKPSSKTAKSRKKEDTLAPVKGSPADKLLDFIRSARTSMVSATVARATGIILLFPLDTMKVNAQVIKGAGARAVAASNLALEERPFKGLIVSLLGNLPAGLITFVMFEALSRKAAEHRRTQKLPLLARTVASAVLADIVASVWLVPLEQLKIKLQSGTVSSVRSVFTMRNRALFCGWNAQMARDIPFRALHLVLFEKLRIEASRRLDRELAPGEIFALGTASSAAVALATTPMDVARSRLMAQRTGSSQIYTGFVECMRQIAKTEGTRTLFRGALLRTLYIVPSSAIFYFVYQRTKRSMEPEASASAASAQLRHHHDNRNQIAALSSTTCTPRRAQRATSS